MPEFEKEVMDATVYAVGCSREQAIIILKELQRQLDNQKQDFFRKIDYEIKDCNVLIKLTEKRILDVKKQRDYSNIIQSMKDVLERKYAIYILKKLKERLQEENKFLIKETIRLRKVKGSSPGGNK